MLTSGPSVAKKKFSAAHDWFTNCFVMETFQSLNGTVSS